MTLFLVQLLNGLQLGILLFLIAAGLTLVFGVMDFINLAHGVQYMLGAYFCVMFYAVTGNFLYALLLALGAGLVAGLVLEFAIYRHLYGRNHLDQVIATFGTILFLSGMVKIVWGSAPLSLPIPEALSGSIQLIEGLVYPVWRIIIIASGVAVGVALYAVVSWTRTGMLIRAGATNAAMVSALGIDIRRLFTIVFGFGSMLAGFAGIMIAPIISVEPGMGDNVLIFAFVVIVIGGIGSIRGAFFAAILLGLVDTLGRFYSVDLLRLFLAPSQARTVGPAIASMLIYLLMALILYFRPSGLFPAKGRRDAGPAQHGGLTRADAPTWTSFAGSGVPTIVFGAFALVPLVTQGGGDSFVLSLLTRVMVFAIAALALDLLIGYGALISFGHAAFIGLGAYTVGILAAHGMSEASIALPAAIAVACIFAYLTGIVALRTKGVYFIMITLAFSQMAFFTVSSLAAYGGDDGLTLPFRNTIFGFDVLSRSIPFYYFTFVCLLISYIICRSIAASRFGRVLRGTKENATRMQSLGFNVFRFHLSAYVISGALAGVSGYLLANATEFVSPSYMSWQKSGELIVMVVLGGMGTLIGSIFGAALYLLSEEYLSSLTEHWKIVFGPLLIAVVLAFPAGLYGTLASTLKRWRHG